ncbi:MAG: sensor histidine kinase [Neorhizobium sp.]|nr:sensor histidine kinase [Neorhizobium sp.]
MTLVHPLTWQRAGQSDDKLREFFLQALVDLGACVIVQEVSRDTLDYVYVANLPDVWAVERFCEPSDVSIFGADIAQKISGLKRGMTEPGAKTHVEIAVGADEVYEFRVQALRSGPDADGGLYLVTTIIDRSEERHRERLLRALLREVSHRSKNLLAIIQSIALQTARYSGSLDLFLHKFRGRLYSLSQSQDLITDSSWRGAYFNDLVQQQTEKYLPENKHLVHVAGDNVLLTPNASLHLGLALHELIVNAVSHGSILKSGRPIEIECLRSQQDGRDWLSVRWFEPLDPSDASASHEDALKAHFGSTVLERVVPASVNGRAQYDISDNGISYQLGFPLDSGAE